MYGMVDFLKDKNHPIPKSARSSSSFHHRTWHPFLAAVPASSGVSGLAHGIDGPLIGSLSFLEFRRSLEPQQAGQYWASGKAPKGTKSASTYGFV